MRGSLKEFGIRSLFHLLESEKSTGILNIETTKTLRFNDNNFRVAEEKDFVAPQQQIDNSELVTKSKSRTWFIFLVNGNITYANDSINQELNRLHDYLRYYQLENTIHNQFNLSVNTTSTLEYECLVLLFQQQFISLKQARAIIYKIVKETVLELLSLSQGSFIFKTDYSLNFSLAEIKIFPLISEIHRALQTWKQFYPHIQSPHQYPLLNIQANINQNLSAKTYNTLSAWVEREASLLQLSRQLNCDLIDLAKALYPYIKQGFIKLKHFNLPNYLPPLIKQQRQTPHIVCVDNDVAIAKKVEYILKRRGYQISLLTDSVQALTAILQIEPDILICKVDLPRLSGYELCNMLKNSQVCHQTKVILLSEQEHLFPRLKAKLILSDDYLSLPFTPNELLIVIEKHLNTRQIQNLSLRETWSTETSINSY